MPRTTTVDVLIIGAGVSGLAAARTLATLKPTLKVLVLEVHTQRTGGAAWGEYTHARTSPLRQLYHPTYWYTLICLCHLLM